MRLYLFIKILYPVFIPALLLTGCYCRNNDCPEPDERLSLRVIDERGVGYDSLGNQLPIEHSGNYADSIAFYVFNHDQQKVEYPIQPSRSYGSSPMAFYVSLSELEPNAQYRYYIDYNGRTSTIDINTRLYHDRCCSELLQFQDIKMDGSSVARIELVFE